MIYEQKYKLPSNLNSFQFEMYVHLIDWKRKHITEEAGVYRGREYDAILPYKFRQCFPHIYPAILGDLKNHRKKYPFRIHKFFNHMASSQAANINLFLPILLHPNGNLILRRIKPDIDRIAVSHLDKGFRVEYWDECFGNLNDKSSVAGTDADIAIAYYNDQNEPCLWLIEHKLTEKEFTQCGGFKSKGREAKHDCNRGFSSILENKSLCYYHDAKKFEYWNITDNNKALFSNQDHHSKCPFQGGMNQLWRNQLLALSTESDDLQVYKHAHFSVVKHPKNDSLDKTLNEYRELIGNSPKFSVFTSEQVLMAVEMHKDSELSKWSNWYKELYRL